MFHVEQWGYKRTEEEAEIENLDQRFFRRNPRRSGITAVSCPQLFHNQDEARLGEPGQAIFLLFNDLRPE